MVLLGAHILQSRTRFGRYSAAIGAGEAAAYASGVKVDRQKVLALTLSGRLRRPRRRHPAPAVCRPARRRSPTSCCCRRSPPSWSAAPRSPAASAASGAPLIGALIISVVRIGMTFVGVNIFAQQIVFGLVLILAVAITIDRSKIPIVK